MASESSLVRELAAQGWEQHLDKNRKRPYWWNRNTGESRWTPPVATQTSTAPAAPVQPIVVATKLSESECRRLGLPVLSTALPPLLREPATTATGPSSVTNAASGYHTHQQLAAPQSSESSQAPTTTSATGAACGAAAASTTNLLHGQPTAATAATAASAAKPSSRKETIDLPDSSDENTDSNNPREDVGAVAAAAVAFTPEAAAASSFTAPGGCAKQASKWPKGDFKVGMQCDAKDAKGTWLRAEILKVGVNSRRGRVRVRYKGYSSKWDEWIPIPVAGGSSNRVRLDAPGSRTGKLQIRSSRGTLSASSSDSDDEQSEGETADGTSPPRGSKAFAALAAANRAVQVGRRVHASLDDGDEDAQDGVVEKYNEDDATFNVRFEDGTVRKRVTHVALEKMLQPLGAAETVRQKAAAAARAHELQQHANNRRVHRQLQKQQQQTRSDDTNDNNAGTHASSAVDDLLAAAEAGNVAQLQRALKAGLHVDSAKKEDGVTALMLAAQEQQHEALTVLLNSPPPRPDVNLVDVDGWTALMYATKTNNVATVQALCTAHADLEIRESQYGMSAFLLACEHGCADVAKVLAQCGADTDAKDRDGSDAKRLAEADQHEAVLQLLQEIQRDGFEEFDGGDSLDTSTSSALVAARKRKRQPEQTSRANDVDVGEEEDGCL